MRDYVNNVFLSGVGGQGTILVSNVLGRMFLGAGFDVKKAQVHSMAQRGGDVTTHFRFGKKVYLSLINEGDVDFLLAFEMLDAVRYLNWLTADGRIIINRQMILPPAVSLGRMEYPADVEGTFRKHFGKNVSVVRWTWNSAKARKRPRGERGPHRRVLPVLPRNRGRAVDRGGEGASLVQVARPEREGLSRGQERIKSDWRDIWLATIG